MFLKPVILKVNTQVLYLQEFSSVLVHWKKILTLTIDNMDTAMFWILFILAFLQGKMTVSIIFRPGAIQSST